MRVLIGTPVWRRKAKVIPQWIASVRALVTDADTSIYLLDNSEDPRYAAYLQRETGWCVDHLHIDADDPEVRISVLNEAIRLIALDEHYDGWFAWDCDILLPPDALDRLLDAAQGYDVVTHVYPDRLEPTTTVGSRFGCAFIRRSALLRHAFAGQVGLVDPLNPGCWCGCEPWWLERVVRDGGTWAELHGVVRPIQHVSH